MTDQHKPLHSLDSSEEDERKMKREHDRRQEQYDHLVQFQGFVPENNPYLIDSPNEYLKRLQDTGTALLVMPDGDEEGIMPRMLVSPIMPIPVVMPREGDLITGGGYEHYPLLHIPGNHPYATPEGEPTDPELPFDQYMLAVSLSYEGMNFVGYTATGDIQTWNDIEDYDIPDDMWQACLETAQSMAPELYDVNTARILEAAAADRSQMKQALALIKDRWQDERKPDTILEDGLAAATILQPVFEVLNPGRAYRPLTKWDPSSAAI
jgi:hypothetical protein